MSDTTLQEGKIMGINEIMKILPHRPPFLLVDKIIEMNLEENYIIGQKNVTMNEEFFNGHFPGAPIMPGVLILEALAQCGAVMVHLKDNKDRVGILLKLSDAKFRHPVKPGDVLILKCFCTHLSARAGRVKAEAIVGDRTVVSGEVSFALVEREKL